MSNCGHEHVEAWNEGRFLNFAFLRLSGECHGAQR